MHRRLILILWCFIVSLTGFTQTQENVSQPMKDIPAFQRNLQEITNNTVSIESDFMQEKHLSFLDEDIITNGKFYFKPKNKLRWEYLDPFEYIIILNDEQVMIKDGEKVNRYDMQSNKIFKEINDLMIELVQGNVVNSDKYAIKYLDNDTNYILELTPQLETMKQLLSQILIYFDKVDFSVVSIKMLEQAGDYTKMMFDNKELNKGIGDSVFDVN